MEEIILEGENYSGRFQGKLQREDYMYRGDTHERHNYFWQGQCAITDKALGEIARFLFKTRDFAGEHSSLEMAVLGVKFIGNKPQVMDRIAVADAVLEPAYKRYLQKLQEGKVIIPELFVPEYDLIGKFEKQGLVKVA